MDNFVAIDVGGTQMRVAIYGEEGITPCKVLRIPTKSSQGTAIERLSELVASMWPDDARVAGIGIAAPGPIDPKKGIIFSAPNIPGWYNLPLQKILEDRFKTPVFLGNDANLAALGEWKYGAGQGYHNLLYITISTGIGGGVITNDQLLVGENGLAAEIGHITILPDGPVCGCGKPGHLEAVASGPAIARYVIGELDQGRQSCLREIAVPTARDVSEAAAKGDALAIEALQRAGRFLGLGITNFLHIFNPSIIILGGGVSKSKAFYMDTLEKTIRESVISPQYLQDLKITAAALGDDAGLLGALALVRSSIIK